MLLLADNRSHARAGVHRYPRGHDIQVSTRARCDYRRIARSRPRRVVRRARGSGGKTGPGTSFIRTRTSAITRSREGRSLRPDCSRSTAPTNPRLTASVLDAHFRTKPRHKQSSRFAGLSIAGAGSETRDLRVMRALLGDRLPGNLQGFREIRSDCARSYLLILVPVSVPVLVGAQWSSRRRRHGAISVGGVSPARLAAHCARRRRGTARAGADVLVSPVGLDSRRSRSVKASMSSVASNARFRRPRVVCRRMPAFDQPRYRLVDRLRAASDERRGAPDGHDWRTRKRVDETV